MWGKGHTHCSCVHPGHRHREARAIAVRSERRWAGPAAQPAGCLQRTVSVCALADTAPDPAREAPGFLSSPWQPGWLGAPGGLLYMCGALLPAGRSAAEELPGPGHRSRSPVQAAGAPGLPEPGTESWALLGPHVTHISASSRARDLGVSSSVLLTGKAQPEGERGCGSLIRPLPTPH